MFMYTIPGSLLCMVFAVSYRDSRVATAGATLGAFLAAPFGLYTAGYPWLPFRLMGAGLVVAAAFTPVFVHRGISRSAKWALLAQVLLTTGIWLIATLKK